MLVPRTQSSRGTLAHDHVLICVDLLALPLLCCGLEGEHLRRERLAISRLLLLALCRVLVVVLALEDLSFVSTCLIQLLGFFSHLHQELECCQVIRGISDFLLEFFDVFRQPRLLLVRLVVACFVLSIRVHNQLINLIVIHQS